MKLQPRFFALLTACIISTNLAAQPNAIISGTIPATITLHTNAIKHFSLQKVVLSKAAKTYIANHMNTVKSLRVAAINLPPTVNLGMENVPVLEQGEFGTCATFAVTGAIDAMLKKGDYISQLCNLTLGAYLESMDDEYPSGWEGSDDETVLGQIQKYGIINKDTQKAQGCGSTQKIYDYPSSPEGDRGSPMTIADFSRFAQSMNNQIYWKPLLSIGNAFSANAHEETVINNAKQALVNGHRIVFDTILDINSDLFQYAGAMGKYHSDHDAFVLTEQIKKDFRDLTDENIPDQQRPVFGGHAMIITGYDDNAVAVEITHAGERIEHKGLFTIRNSVSAAAGDKGTFYMSYDHFKTLTLGAEEVSPTPLN